MANMINPEELKLRSGTLEGPPLQYLSLSLSLSSHLATALSLYTPFLSLEWLPQGWNKREKPQEPNFLQEIARPISRIRKTSIKIGLLRAKRGQWSR